MRFDIDDTVLRAVASPVDTTDRFRLRRIERALLEAMFRLKGIGLAAPQCGLGIRAVAIGLGIDAALFNPEILDRSADVSERVEGCLSLGRREYMVPRASWVELAWTDSHGKRQRGRAEDLLARVVQHEVDHLDGMLIDRFPSAPAFRGEVEGLAIE